MTAEPLDPFADVLIPRDQYDRPFIAPPGGGKPEPYTRASTFCSMLSDSSGIAKWKLRHLAIGIGRYEDLAAMAAGLEYGRDNAELDDVIGYALDRVGTNAKANYGTAIHTMTERDAFDFVPERMQADVNAYRALIEACGIEVVSSERFVVQDELKVAGTYDHVYSVPARLYPPGGELTDGDVDELPNVLVMGDKKTGTLHWHEHALQLALYARSAHYDPTTGEREPLGVSLDWALLAHIPAGKAKPVLYWVDIGAGWRATALAQQVQAYRKAKDLATVLTPPAMAAAKPVERPSSAERKATRDRKRDKAAAAATALLNAEQDAKAAEKPAADRSTRSNGKASEPTVEQAAAALADLAGVLDGTGAHAEHERKQVGRCVYCSCGARVQGRMETASAHDKAVELVKGELNGRELTPDERLAEAVRVAVSVTALKALWRTRKAIWTEKHTALAAERRALIEAGKA